MAEIFQLKHSGEQIDALLDKASTALQPTDIPADIATQRELSALAQTTDAKLTELSEELGLLIEDLQNTKIDKEADDYYPQLSVGTADNLAGVDEVASEFSFRRSGGGAIADGVARVQSIKGNSVVIDGEVISMNTIGIKSVGRNQWNEQWELGGINTSDGIDYDATNSIKSGYIRILVNTKYYFKKPQGITTYLYFYDENKNFVGYLDPFVTSGVGGVFTTMDAPYMRFMVAQDAYHHDICLNISDTDFNGQYEPYIEDSEDLSIMAKYFPNGMRSVSGAHDEIYYNKSTNRWEKVVRVGEVDMGDKSISLYNASLNIFYLKIDDIKVATTTEERHTGLLCSRYSMDYDKVNPSAVAAMLDKTLMRYPDGRVFLKDSAYTDAASLKASLQGEMLYYELAEPIVTEIEEKDFNLDYKVWNCGTEQMVATEPSAPLAADITYGFNAVGLIKQLRSMIEALSAKVESL